MDEGVARSQRIVLEERRAAGGEQHRYVLARRVHDGADAVGSANADMHHHSGQLARDDGVTVCHRQLKVLVRRGDRRWRRRTRYRCFGIAFNDRREIRAGVGEQILDTTIAENGEIGFGCAGGDACLRLHGELPNDALA